MPGTTWPCLRTLALLDIVIREFNNGAEPHAIAQGYPTLHLADAHGVIAYYLRHRKEIDD